MYPEEEKIHQLDMKVRLIERDIEQVDRLCDKISESIEKLQEVNISLTRMITLHEQRHEQHERVELELKDDVKEIHSRITTVNRELYDKIDDVERSITDKIEGLRKELLKHESRDATKLPDILREIDKYKYLIIGGIFALGWFIGNINLSAFGTLIK
jgi:chromosome segregation ATPase